MYNLKFNNRCITVIFLIIKSKCALKEYLTVAISKYLGLLYILSIWKQLYQLISSNFFVRPLADYRIERFSKSPNQGVSLGKIHDWEFPLSQSNPIFY